jgi:site-specific DNA recombinase
MEEIMQSKKSDASSELAPDRHTAIYARENAVQPAQSTLDVQVEACVRQVAEDRAPEIGAAYVFRDEQSGAELDRSGLNQLRRAVRAGEVGVVYAYSLDRLSRSLRHFMLLLQEFEEAGVELRFVRGFSDESPDHRLISYILGYSGQKERLTYIERNHAREE